MHSAHDPTLGRFKLYLMDVYGNRELLYEGGQNVLYAQPVRPRKAPPQLPDTADMVGSERRVARSPPWRVLLQQHLRRRAAGGCASAAGICASSSRCPRTTRSASSVPAANRSAAPGRSHANRLRR